jgi:hypothetical protein
VPSTKHISAKSGDVLLLVGTMKGLFVLRSNGSRKRWEAGGPYSAGSPVYAAAFDSRQSRNRMWWAQQSFRWGTILRSSDDFGKASTEPETYSIKFPAESGWALKNIWQILIGPSERPNTVYCGVEPSALFESQDAGKTWSLSKGLFDHPHRQKWTPGGGGQCLHTILPHFTDPKRMIVAMSTGGAYRTDDEGASWQPRNQNIRAEFLPEKYPEFGQCVHKISGNPAQPDRLYLQNHWGLYRSDDFGDSWRDIANGVPSDFGFCMVAHPHDHDTAYIVPIESDEYRCTPEGKLRVYRTRNDACACNTCTAQSQLGAAHSRVAAEECFGNRAARQFDSGHARSSRNLLRHPQRESVRLQRRGQVLAITPGRSSGCRVREDGACRRGSASDSFRFVTPGNPCAKGEWALTLKHGSDFPYS